MRERRDSANVTGRRRWPRWLYDHGQEPDVRFSLANERTFLAWTRTAIAFLAAGVVLDSVDISLDSAVRAFLVVTTLCLGLACALGAWVHWARAEKAMRHGRPLPVPALAGLVSAGLVVMALVLLCATW